MRTTHRQARPKFSSRWTPALPSGYAASPLLRASDTRPRDHRRDGGATFWLSSSSTRIRNRCATSAQQLSVGFWVDVFGGLPHAENASLLACSSSLHSSSWRRAASRPEHAAA